MASLKTGHPLGPYQIVSPIGAGGMGEVYRALDTRLNRTVAIKVLPPHLSAIPEWRDRFEREARAISSLNHPYICTLHDIGEQDGIHFLVMEHLEGETLAKRLERGPLPLDEALKRAIEIADGLDKAHRQGLTHRDLKPGNIMLTKQCAKLLDFGLAKLKPTADSGMQTSNLPTAAVPSNLTAHGTIVGTLQYMAPEQLEGIEADARSDIFAFGAVLYEMLTGRRAFEGHSQSSVIAAIMHVDPPSIASLQPMTPASLDRIVKICLAKDPDERWQTAHDLGLQLQWIAEGGSQAGVPDPIVGRRRGREKLAWILFAAAGVLALAMAIPMLRYLTSHETGQVRFDVVAPPLFNSFQITISPDGRKVAYVATSNGKRMLFVRPIDSFAAQPLPGTEDAFQPFWSPDSRFLAFGGAEDKLKKVDANGSAPAQTICEVQGASTNFGSGTWSSDGVIVFGSMQDNVLHRVSAAGGVPVQISKLDVPLQEIRHAWPQFLPDGRHFLYLAWSNKVENRAVYAGSLDSDARVRVMAAESMVAYAPEGYLLYQREGTLLTQHFDPSRLALSGEPVRVADDISFNASNGRSAFAVSSTGTLVYRTGDAEKPLSWISRDGKPEDIATPPGKYRSLALSPDGERLAFGRQDGDNEDVWIQDLTRSTPSRFTFDPMEDDYPVWSPDGKRIVFSSNRSGTYNLYVKDSSGTGNDELLLKSERPTIANDWSSDGRFVLFGDTGPKTKNDLRILPVDGDRKPTPFLETPFNERDARFSPDGRWIAYISNESGRSELYVQSFPPTGGKWQISTGSARAPRWRPDGKEIFFLRGDSWALMAADIVTAGTVVKAGIPHQLFEAQFSGYSYPYDVSHDGQRFIVNATFPTAENTTTPIHVVLNWTAGLKQ